MKINYVWEGFSGLSTIALIVLKLTGYIDWGWVYVMAPMWAPIATFIAIGIIFFLIND